MHLLLSRILPIFLWIRFNKFDLTKKTAYLIVSCFFLYGNNLTIENK